MCLVNRLFITIGFVALLVGCGEERRFQVVIAFPQGARERARVLRVASVKPGEGATCQALQDGTAAPDDPGYALEDQIEMDPGASYPGRRLTVEKAGPRLFYAEAEHQTGLVFVRGCTPVEVGNHGDSSVRIVLQLVVECLPGDDCDDGDACTAGDTCGDDGVCSPGSSEKDADADGFVDEACGGDDCDDSDFDINPGGSEESAGSDSCTDGRDNDCDGLTDSSDPGCRIDWWDPNWTRRRKLSFDNLDSGEDLAGFPVLVVLNGARIDYQNTQDSGEDLRFVDSDDATPLAHEIEAWDESGTSLVWVNVPQIDGSSDADFVWMYYGNPGAPDGQDPPGVWGPDYQGVWHLKESPAGTPGEIEDSTSNQNHGNTEGGMDAGSSVGAKIGRGLQFDEIDDLIRMPDSPSLDTTGPEGTFELWIYWQEPADGTHQIVMTSSNRFTAGARDGYEWASQGDGDHFFYPWGGSDSNYNLGLNPFTPQTWHYLAVTFDYSVREVSIFVDAAPMAFTEERVATEWISIASPDDWLWGGNPDIPDRYFEGRFDEIRVSSTVRSPAWLRAQFMSMNDAAFVVFGAEEAL
jgi:hypothetical protein